MNEKMKKTVKRKRKEILKINRRRMFIKKKIKVMKNTKGKKNKKKERLKKEEKF